MPALRIEAGGPQRDDQGGLHSKFLAPRSKHTVRSCLKLKKKKNSYQVIMWQWRARGGLLLTMAQGNSGGHCE